MDFPFLAALTVTAMILDTRKSAGLSGGNEAAAPVPVTALRLVSDSGVSQGPRAPLRSHLPIRVVSSNRLTREALAELLGQQTGFDVESLGPEALGRTSPSSSGRHEIIVLDHATDREHLVQLATKIWNTMPYASVIVTGLADNESIVELADAGVRAFVMRSASPDELVATIGTMAVDTAPPLVPGMIMQPARGDARAPRSHARREAPLTAREQQVIQLIVDGMCNKEIAAALGVAIHTVKSHVHNVLQKLSVGSRLALAAQVRQQGGVRSPMFVRVTKPTGMGSDTARLR